MIFNNINPDDITDVKELRSVLILLINIVEDQRK